MGTLIEDYEIGDNCALASGVLWDIDKTPKHIRAFFWDIKQCFFPGLTPPNGQFLLTQDPILPCVWRYTGPVWSVAYRLEGNTNLTAFDTVQSDVYFVGGSVDIVDKVWSTRRKIHCSPFFKGYEGVCQLVPASAAIARIIGRDYNFSPLDETYSDRWDILPTKYMVSMRSIKHASDMLAIWNPELY